MLSEISDKMLKTFFLDTNLLAPSMEEGDIWKEWYIVLVLRIVSNEVEGGGMVSLELWIVLISIIWKWFWYTYFVFYVSSSLPW